MENKKYLTKAQIDNLSVEELSEDKKARIMELKNSLDMSDESILDFGSAATKNLSDFSTSMLKSIRMKDFPEIDQIVGTLMQELSKVDSNTLLSYKPSKWKRFFRIDDLESFLKDFTSKFENASDVIAEIRKKLEDARYELKKDMVMCDDYMDKNLTYINELDECIVAGKLKLREVEAEIAEDMKTLDKSDQLAVHMVSEKQGAQTRLEASIRDLCLIRENAVQNMHRLRLIKDGDAALIEKIKSSISMAIPLWESEMLVAFIVARQQNCADMEKAISDTTNNLIKVNSELVKAGAIKIAQEMQRGIIDIDTLKASNQKLIETFTEVKKITEEGKGKRQKAIEELGNITIGLNEAILLEDKRRS